MEQAAEQVQIQLRGTGSGGAVLAGAFDTD